MTHCLFFRPKIWTQILKIWVYTVPDRNTFFFFGQLAHRVIVWTPNDHKCDFFGLCARTACTTQRQGTVRKSNLKACLARTLAHYVWPKPMLVHYTMCIFTSLILSRRTITLLHLCSWQHAIHVTINVPPKFGY